MQQPVVIQVPDGPAVVAGGDPSEIYEAFRQQRSELRSQLERLESRRRELQRQLSQSTSDADRRGIEGRLAQTDQRITNVDRMISEADAAVARSAAVPGAVVEQPPPRRDGPPEEAFVLGGLFIFVVGLPLTIAFARRIWRRGAATVAAIPQEIYDRFNRLDHAIDAVAIEVERIGEGQRFLTKIESERHALDAGPAQRARSPEPDAIRERSR